MTGTRTAGATHLDAVLDHKHATWEGGTAVTDGLPARRALPARPGTFAAALRRATVTVIAEVKPRSPSKGDLWPTGRAVELARDYAALGAAAVSVLAEDRFFGGSPALVRAVATDPAVTVPVLYKDFVVDARQVELAHRAGADAVLVIVRAVDDTVLDEVAVTAAAAGIDMLVETFTADDIERALAVGARVVGINNRDLQSFRVDLDAAAALRALVPDDVVTVSESGIATAADVRRMADAGFDAVLVGETLLRSAHAGSLGAVLAELSGVVR